MLYVVKNDETKKILFRVDAWDQDCERKATDFIMANNLNVVNDEITIMGDRVIWVD